MQDFETTDFQVVYVLDSESAEHKLNISTSNPSGIFRKANSMLVTEPSEPTTRRHQPEALSLTFKIR